MKSGPKHCEYQISRNLGFINYGIDQTRGRRGWGSLNGPKYGQRGGKLEIRNKICFIH